MGEEGEERRLERERERKENLPSAGLGQSQEPGACVPCGNRGSGTWPTRAVLPGALAGSGIGNGCWWCTMLSPQTRLS